MGNMRQHLMGHELMGHERRFLKRCAFATWVLAACAAAAELPAAKPESVGLSSERLERIATAVQRSIDDKRIAGAVTLVSRRGQVAWLKAQGMMDR
jgi:CubicO group peptidase (beta-lactamase class C family)